MTPEQAIENLDKVASIYSGNRADHTALVDSVKVIRDFIASANRRRLSRDTGQGEPKPAE